MASQPNDDGRLPERALAAPADEQQRTVSLLSSANVQTAPAAYRRLLAYHCIALLPTLVMLVAALVASIHSRSVCDLHIIDRNHNDRQAVSCSELLDLQMIASCIVLGAATWLATYACRRGSWSFAASLTTTFFSQGSQDQGTWWFDPEHLIVSIAVLLQSLLSEALRVFSFYLASCILLARIHELLDEAPQLVLVESAKHREPPTWAWRISFRDPRFLMALWVSLAWSSVEFLSGSALILHQLALYRPDLAIDAGGDSAWSHPVFSRRFVDLESTRQSGGRDKGSSACAATPTKVLNQARSRLLNSQDHQSRPAAQPDYGTISSHQQHLLSLATSKGRSTGNEHDDDDPDAGQSSSSASTMSASTDDSDLALELDDQVQQLLLAKERAELEGVLGIPLPEIPVALCSLWRIDALLWSVGSGLLLSAIIAHAQGSLGDLTKHGFSISPDFDLLPPLNHYAAAFAVLVLLHATISAVWATSLPAIGFASATYGSLLVGISLLLAGLARWGFLV